MVEYNITVKVIRNNDFENFVEVNIEDLVPGDLIIID
jgi:magnesium-transporting ATPase (P-type)